MYVDFDELPGASKVWIYQAKRGFNSSEIQKIYEILKNFVNNWKRHGDDLRGSFIIAYNQFIILAVDESYNDVSGCSIDASVNIIKQIEKDLNIDLLNKTNVSFKDGDNINTVTLNEFKEYVKLQKIKDDTVVFNNLVSSKADFESSWEVEACKSWHSKFLV